MCFPASVENEFLELTKGETHFQSRRVNFTSTPITPLRQFLNTLYKTYSYNSSNRGGDIFTNVMVRFKLGDFAKNVLTLITGTTLAQAIPFFVSPILTRLYSPEDFGVYALFMSVVAMVSVIATARYELAIMIPAKEKDAVNIVALSMFIALCVSISALVFICFFNGSLTKWLNNREISPFLYFLPVSVLLIGVYQTFNYWTNRKKKYKRLAIATISQSTTTAATNILFGFGGAGWGLIVGGILGQLASSGALAGQVWKEDRGQLKHVRKKDMLANAKAYQDFPKINLFHAFVDMLQSSGVVFIISTFFSAIVLGYYSFTMRILKTPLGLIGSAVSQVFFQQASETYQNQGDLQALVKKTMLRLGIIAIPIFILFVLCSPLLFSFVFGEKWREAGVYAQLLSPWLFVNFIVSPTTHVPIILQKQKKAFYYSIVFNFSMLASFLSVGLLKINIIDGFIIMSALGTVYTTCYGFWIFKISAVKKGMVS
ncbi:MAG: polysaccharide biosynthesis protein [Bacilli bacterium]|nr:polysaccharide biosynthesis protein [Bacilli bacterium]